MVVTVEVIAGSNSSLQANHWALVVIALEVVMGVVAILVGVVSGHYENQHRDDSSFFSARDDPCPCRQESPGLQHGGSSSGRARATRSQM